MPGLVPHPSLPLSRRGPRRVRSAVIQAISPARTSQALTWGWASESMNGQLRREAEWDGPDLSPDSAQIASRTGRLHDEGAEAPIRLPEPANKLPEFVGSQFQTQEPAKMPSMISVVQVATSP